VKLVLADNIPREPWRNGGGCTRELLAGPGTADWRFRISLAEVATDGAFSFFAGVQRWFAVIEGAGVELTIDDRRERVRRDSAPLSFSGAAATTCRLLDGATLDLNLMLRGATGSMSAAIERREWRPKWQQCGFFSVVAGRCAANGTTTDIPSHALLWFERAPSQLSFEPTVRAAPPSGWWLEVGIEDAIR
jgi:environmental stress-induced protein Ves